MDIYAIYDEHVQIYRVTFHPESRAIITPEYEDIEYGSFATSPEITNIPDNVNFVG